MGLIATLGGTFWLLPAAEIDTGALVVPALVTAAGGIGLIGSLAWLAWRGIQIRRHLAGREPREVVDRRVGRL